MILIDKLSSKPVYEQIIDGIERAILLGTFPPGSAIPSLREMAVTLGINPNTIQKSYMELTRRGIIRPALGSGSYVSEDALTLLRSDAEKTLAELADRMAELRLAGLSEEEILASVKERLEKATAHRPNA